MKGYPKYIATKQDFINLLNDNKYKERAKKDLQSILDNNDEKVKIAKTRKVKNPLAGKEHNASEFIDEEYEEIIDNPNPVFKIKGFSSYQEIAELISGEKYNV